MWIGHHHIKYMYYDGPMLLLCASRKTKIYILCPMLMKLIASIIVVILI